MTDVNLRLCEGNTSAMFVTAWLAIVTLSTGEVTEANAGHENPLLLRKKEKEEEKNEEEAEKEKFISFMKQRDAKYKDAAEEE